MRLNRNFHATSLQTRSIGGLPDIVGKQWQDVNNLFTKLDEGYVLGLIGKGVKGGDDILEEINRIKNLRQTNSAKRIEELGTDLDKSAISLTEGKAGFEIEEQYGYFKRFKSTPDKKGDWESLSGVYKGKTFDEIGGNLGENALKEFGRKPSQKTKFFESIDLHFTKADYVVLNLTEMKRLQPALYEETLNYIINKYERSKLINITK